MSTIHIFIRLFKQGQKINFKNTCPKTQLRNPLILEMFMKSSDLPIASVALLNKTSDVQELKAFNSQRAMRGLQPVSQQEYDELTLKVGAIWHKAFADKTIH